MKQLVKHSTFDFVFLIIKVTVSISSQQVAIKILLMLKLHILFQLGTSISRKSIMSYIVNNSHHNNGTTIYI